MNFARNLFTLLGILSLIDFSSQLISDEARLHSYLFGPSSDNSSSYNPNVRPIRNANKRIPVDVRVGIKRIFEMDETNHRVVLFAILIKKWRDEFLVWDPKDFGNITYTYVEYTKIWTPKFEHLSKYIDEKSSPSDNSIHETYEKFPIKLFFNGDVRFVPSLHLTSECLFNYGKYPFEFQFCNFYFQMPYDLKQANLTMATFYTREFFDYEPLWNIEDINQLNVMDDNQNPIYIMRLSFKRLLRNYLYTMPSYIVYILTLLMFLLPQTSNQRIIIGGTCLVITSLLSYMMSNSLPHNDISAWPLLGKLYLFNMILLTFSLIFSAFIINVSQSEHIKSVPDWLKKFTISVLSKIFCIQAVAYTVFNSYSFKVHDDENIAVQEQITSQLVMSPIDSDVVIRHRDIRTDLNESNEVNDRSKSKTTTESNKTQGSFDFTKLLKKVYNHLEQMRYKLQRDTYKTCTNNEWLLVGILMDKILFLLYCSIVIFSTMAIFKN